jgi:hypothetical protein
VSQQSVSIHTEGLVQPYPANQNEADHWLHRYRALESTTNQLYAELTQTKLQMNQALIDALKFKNQNRLLNEKLSWLIIPTTFFLLINRTSALLWSAWHRTRRTRRRNSYIV